MLALRLVSGQIDRRRDQGPEQVGFVVIVRPCSTAAIRSRPMPVSIDGLRQVDTLIRRHLLVLHEDEVPDLDEPVAILIRRARRAAGNVLAVIVEDFRTRTAGPVSPIAQKLSDVGCG
jgi:riboflavin synthase